MSKLRQDVSIGSNLRALRMARGLTQAAVAAQLQLAGRDISRSVYSRYETGELNIPIGDLVVLRDIFRCGYDDFFAGLKAGKA